MQYEYDIAVSFAGEDRHIVENIVNVLRERSKISVFYDRLEEHKLWGKNLYQYLSTVYSKKAKYCLVFISKDYLKKKWTRHELESAQARAFIQDNEYILPIKLDDTVLPGIPETIGYIDYREKALHDIVTLIIKKIPGAVNQLVEKDSLLFWKVTTIMNTYDPMGFFPMAPLNEYDLEVRAIIEQLDKKQNKEEIKNIVDKVFQHYFGMTIEENVSVAIAYRIYNVIQGDSNDLGFFPKLND
ncbi:toll/interleukin-1 receptor domain-containing protein [Bacillus cereus]|uniref:toll/interleukin-1 receptor domain-containing protein n=1 Tax=Bacillus cereus TaxID=1396 RepID=UPI0014954D64|nr:TIR domain-containing protein [Bacillus cereus]QKE10632.1 TIR domain-containing protein [Bacillus cereus]